ncbi:hypothetical protein [uncultured Endozoicomonas sp.]|uniref:hypothetical protein n=1 Tax=uncultured Endozoicomonas sp. TaxID=432652 RepID=UPI002609FBC1|nr:hypothetical protein [uncultured Endozoicomonas sp.]
MANIIKIKRSAVTATPPALEEGELAYSETSGNLFFGLTGGNMAVIGGLTPMNKLAGIAPNANNYSLPSATSSARGGVKIGDGIEVNGDVISVDFTGYSTTSEMNSAINAQINALVNGAPGTLDTLKELADAISSNDTEISALLSSINGRMEKSKNLSDLSNKSTARSNLGLKSMAEQASSSVAITGGTASGLTISNSNMDGGSF